MHTARRALAIGCGCWLLAACGTTASESASGDGGPPGTTAGKDGSSGGPDGATGTTHDSAAGPPSDASTGSTKDASTDSGSAPLDATVPLAQCSGATHSTSPAGAAAPVPPPQGGGAPPSPPPAGTPPAVPALTVPAGFVIAGVASIASARELV